MAFLTSNEKEILEWLAEHIVPNAPKWGVADYVEKFLGAFDHHPPTIYAGGPFSGRVMEPGDPSPPNEFVTFLPLTRVQETAWRLRLLGTQEAAVTHPHVQQLAHFEGYQKMLKGGLFRARQDRGTVPHRKARVDVFFLMQEDFRDLLTRLTLEACFSAPEYGGNKGLKGWKEIFYRGDTLPFGYSTYAPDTGYRERVKEPISGPEPVDPEEPSFFGSLWLKAASWFGK